MFKNETFYKWQLEVWDLSYSSRVRNYLEDSEKKLIICFVGWERKDANYSINIENEVICNIHSEAKKKEGNSRVYYIAYPI